MRNAMNRKRSWLPEVCEQCLTYIPFPRFRQVSIQGLLSSVSEDLLARKAQNLPYVSIEDFYVVEHVSQSICLLLKGRLSCSSPARRMFRLRTKLYSDHLLFFPRMLNWVSYWTIVSWKNAVDANVSVQFNEHLLDSN